MLYVLNKMSKADSLSIFKDFLAAKEILVALGDEIRQDILAQLAVAPNGLRVSEINPCRKLTRPCLSHHIKVLLKAQLIDVYHEGKKNYYYLCIAPEKMEEVFLILTKLNHFSKKRKNDVSSV